MTSRLVFLSLLTTLGCGPQVEPVDAPLSLLDAISVTATGQLAPSALTFSVSGGVSGPDKTAAVRVNLAELALRLDVEGDAALLRFVDLPLGDLTISPEALPPVGLKLVNLRLGVETAAPLKVVGKNADELWLASSMGLRLSWSLALPDGSTYALGPIRLAAIEVSARIYRVEDGYRMTLHASCDEACWTLPNLLSVRDMEIDLEAPVTVTAIDRSPFSLPPAHPGDPTVVD